MEMLSVVTVYVRDTPMFHFRFADHVLQAYQIIATKVKMLSASPEPFDNSILQPHPPVDIFSELSDIIDETGESSNASTEEIDEILAGPSDSGKTPHNK